MYRTVFGILLSLLAALGLVGLTFSASIEEPAQFRFGNVSEPRTLDPGVATGQPEHRLISELFEGLTRLEAKSMIPIPAVAERWETTPDELTYKFYLRKDARWSDGRPVTARDFVYSWQRLLDPGRGADYAYLLYMVRHAEAYNHGASSLATLRTKLKPKLQTLLDSNTGVPAAKLQEVLAETDSVGALQQSPDPELGAFLARRTGNFSHTELGKLAGQVDAEIVVLDARLRAAHDHFGKDEGLYATDDHTLVVQLRSPTPYFLALLAFYPLSPVPQWVTEQPGHALDWFLPRTIVTNGPYTLQSWRVNDRIRLVRSNSYWDKQNVHIERIDALPIDNATTGLNLYLTGAVDWLPDLYPPDLVHDLRTREDFYSSPGMTVYFYRLNCERGPLRDRRVRQALNLAVDRTVIVDDVLGLGQLPAYGTVPPGMPGYTSPSSGITYDPARARELLAAAGYPEGKGFPTMGILYNTMEKHKQIAEVVADQLRRNLGIPVTAYNQEWQSYLATVRALDFDIARAGWVGDYPDPNTFLDSFVTNGGNNMTGFSSPAYDTLIHAAGNIGEAIDNPERVLGAVHDRATYAPLLKRLQQSTDAEQKKELTRNFRLQILAEAEAVLVQDEFPVMPIYFYVNAGLLSRKVSGFYSRLELPDGSQAANLQDIHPLEALSVKP